MDSFTKAGAAIALAVIFTTMPAGAQQAVQEPGAYSFYHPNGDVLNAGRPTPAATPGMARSSDDAMAQMRTPLRAHRASRGAARRE